MAKAMKAMKAMKTSGKATKKDVPKAPMTPETPRPTEPKTPDSENRPVSDLIARKGLSPGSRFARSAIQCGKERKREFNAKVVGMRNLLNYRKSDKYKKAGLLFIIFFPSPIDSIPNVPPEVFYHLVV